MRYQVLGAVRIGGEVRRTISAPKVGTLLAALLIRANEAVSTDELIDEVWGQGPPKQARSALHVYVSQLRKQLPDSDDAIRTHGFGYVMDVDPAQIDATVLQRLHAEGQRLAEHDPAAALERFQAAAALFRGPVLARESNGLIVGTFARWAEEVRLECMEAVAACAMRVGREREVVRELSRWVREHPLNETLREQLMVALHRSGRRAEALGVYQEGRRILRDELGLDPRITMRQLQTAILRDEADEAPLAQVG